MPPAVSFSLQNVTAVCEMVSSQAYLCEKKYSRAGNMYIITPGKCSWLWLFFDFHRNSFTWNKTSPLIKSTKANRLYLKTREYKVLMSLMTFCSD